MAGKTFDKISEISLGQSSLQTFWRGAFGNMNAAIDEDGFEPSDDDTIVMEERQPSSQANPVKHYTPDEINAYCVERGLKSAYSNEPKI